MSRKKINRKRTKNKRKNQKGGNQGEGNKGEGGFFDFFKSKLASQPETGKQPNPSSQDTTKDDSKCIEYTKQNDVLVQEHNKIKEDIKSKNIDCSSYKPSFWQSFTKSSPCDKLEKNISAIKSNFTDVNNSCNYQNVNEVREKVRPLGVMVGGKRRGKKTRRHKRKKHHRTKKNKSHRKK
jgi:hypothetical protein